MYYWLFFIYIDTVEYPIVLSGALFIHPAIEINFKRISNYKIF
jgi:hypothetical protein